MLALQYAPNKLQSKSDILLKYVLKKFVKDNILHARSHIDMEIL